MKAASTILSALLLIPGVLSAKENPKHTYYINADLSFPAKPAGFANHWKPGVGGGFGIGQWLTPRLTLVGHFGYHRFNSKNTVDGGDWDLTAYTIMASLKTDLMVGRHGEALYLISGLGYFKLTSDGYEETYPWAERTSGTVNESNLALYIGPGFDFKLTGKTGIFAELDYSICFSLGVSTEFIALKAGFWLIAF